MKKVLLCFTSLFFLLSPKVNFGQAINLGTAAKFVLFTTTGAVGNTGISQVTGNVGTNSGSTTGFGNVNGVMHNNNGATSLAAADLLTAYDQLNTTIPQFFPAPLLGNGDTLKAGVYSISGNTSLNNSLTLDGQGDPNAIFIFQIQAPLSTTAASQVILINGTKACNVFWKVEGLVSMASGTTIRGNIIANNAAINMNTGVTLEGRALSTTGAVNVSGVLAYLPTGCGSPLLTGPASPALGSTACYAIFSGNGSVINAGISNVSGDIGTNVGLAVGYDPLLVNGSIHPLPDVSTAACASDLLHVYNYLNLLTEDIELLYPAQFGNNLVLTPHTYVMNGAATFTDTLYLNAEGNPNAVFVIKVNGAFSTTTFAKVKLVNGTKAGNVFWKVEGAVNLNDYCEFKGTIICNNGAISLNTGVLLEGKALTTNGALSSASISTTMPPVCAILPVTWLYFRGKAVSTAAVLEWGTSNEINNGFFTVEKSRDAVVFEKFARAEAVKVNNLNGNSYSITDANPYSIGYYRLSQTDKDGKTQYYKTVRVQVVSQQMQIVHFLDASRIYVQITGTMLKTGTLELHSADGRKISAQKILSGNESATYSFQKPAEKGLFILSVATNGKCVYQSKIMIL